MIPFKTADFSEATGTGGVPPSQGRPLGYLMAWAAACDFCVDQSIHKSWSPTHLQRQAGRAALELLALTNTNARRLLECERPKREGEESESEDFYM